MNTNKEIHVLDYKFQMDKTEGLAAGFIKGIATTPKIDSYDDIIVAGAFADSIKDRGVTGPRAVKMLAQHKASEVIGNWVALNYIGDALHCEGQIDLENVKGMEMYTSVKKDQIGSLSVGFTTQVRQYDEETWVRSIIKGDLREISLVTFPANEDAVITQIKSILGENETDGGVEKLSDLEKKLARDFGLSRKQSCGIIRVIKSSKLFASAPLVPAASGVTSKEKQAEQVKSINKIVNDLKMLSAVDEVRRLTEALRS